MRKILFAAALITCFTTAFSQEKEPEEKERPIFFEDQKPAWREKIRLGGNVWLGFFGSFYVDVSPMIGYQLTDKGTVAGLGATMIYQGTWQGEKGGELMIGPRIWARQQIWKMIFAHAEYELINARTYRFYSAGGQTTGNLKKWEGSPLAGLGFYRGRGATDRGSYISVMYNLGYPNKGFISPQGLGGNNSPIVLRFGFLF